MSSSEGRVAVLGAGKMGEALLSGLLRSGRSANDLIVTTRRPERAADLTARYGVEAMDNTAAAKAASILVLAAKPQDMAVLVDEIAPVVAADTLVISMAAGIPTAFFERRLTEGVAVIRVMSNTPVLVDEAMSVLSPGANVTEAQLAATEALLQPVGKTLRVPESQQDAVTALSGSGPAYFFYLVEAMIDAGILLGLPRSVAADLIVQTAVGAATMLRDTGEHPVKLREQVTSPAGTTISAIYELEKHGVRAALLSALEAACDRSCELAKGVE